MNIASGGGEFSETGWGKAILGCALSLVLVIATLPQNLWAQQDQGGPDQSAPPQGAAAPPY
ncbi:MAG: hypothetical protein WAM78_00095, partial [Candidatus Sulfotelmatobacter sp.]